MSGNIGDDSSIATYAVVDLSKKRRNNQRAEKNVSSNIELYSVVQSEHVSGKKTTKERYVKTNVVDSQPSNNNGKDNVESVYSVLDQNSEPQEVQPDQYHQKIYTSKSYPAHHSFIYKIVMCLTIILCGIVVLACISVALSMIAHLKSDVTILWEKMLEKKENNSLNNSMQLTESVFKKFSLSLSESVRDIKSVLDKSDRALCNLSQSFNSKLNVSVQNFIHSIHQLNVTCVNPSALSPAPSCQYIHKVQPSALSGYYWVRSSNGCSVQVYCEMTMKCNGTRGLQRVALINNAPDIISVSMNQSPGCSSTVFPLMNISYSHICGSIEGFGIHSPDGFFSYTESRPTDATINENYVDGISLTYGQMPNRQHIWTFSARGVGNCADNKPAYVGSSFSCLPRIGSCSSSNSCSKAAFLKQLQQTTSEDVEMRLCQDQESQDENIAIRRAEIYVW